MRPAAHVAVSARREVEVALHLIQLERAVDATAVRRRTPQPRRLPPLCLAQTQRDDIVDVLLSETFVVLDRRTASVPFPGNHAALGVAAQAVHALAVDPVRPEGGVALEPLGGVDAVARGVLDVDVQVLAAHLDDHVDVDGQDVADALFDGEGVLLLAAPPAGQLGAEEDEGDEHHGDGPFAA